MPEVKPLDIRRDFPPMPPSKQDRYNSRFWRYKKKKKPQSTQLKPKSKPATISIADRKTINEQNSHIKSIMRE